MNMLDTLKGSYFSEILPAGWDIAKISACTGNPPEAIFERQHFWDPDFTPVECVNLEEFGVYMGHEIALQIKRAKDDGKKLILILPVGPMGMYKWAVYFLKAWGADCTHVYGFNMDEWADADGNTLYTGTAPCNASYFVFSSPELTSGSSYTLYAADTSVGSATAQTGTTSGNTPGGQPGGQPGSGEQPPVKPDDGEQPPAKPDDTGSTGTTGSTGSSSTSTSGSTTGSTTGSTGSSDSSSTTASSSDSSTSSTGTTTTSEDADTAATDSTTSSKKSRKNKSTTTNTDEDSDSSSDTKKSPSKHGKKETSDESSNTPKTGESSHTILWIVLLVLSGGTLVASLILWKKKSEE